MDLPTGLRLALQRELDASNPEAIVVTAQAISERYRAGHGRSDNRVLGSALEALAYATYRLPATFAALSTVYLETARRLPGFQPASMLDAGAGPGTALHAGAEVWPDLAAFTAIERDPRMVRLGTSLAAGSRSGAVRAAAWQESDLHAPWQAAPADLTTAGYVLGELSPASRRSFVARLWEHTTQTCVLVEPGTPRGYTHIREAGEYLTGAGAHLVAPFPASWTCVENADDWCHFSVRIPRSSLLRRAKGGVLAYEDEKFAYLVASRTPGPPMFARVIRHPQARSGHVRLVLCTAQGIHHVVVSRSQGAVYHRARHLAWGDVIPPEDAAAYGLE